MNTERKPEHYPKWLRDLLYDPFVISNMRSAWAPDPERNWATLLDIRQMRYRIDARDALIFDMCIEKERDVIHQQRINKTFQTHIMNLEDKVGILESKLRGIGDAE